MGNSQSEGNAMNMFHSYENRNGKLLLAAIKNDCLEEFHIACETARKEFVRPKTRSSNAAGFDDMLQGMYEYLTRPYDIGNGPLFTKTPLQYAEMLKSTKIIGPLTEKIKELEKSKPAIRPVDNVFDGRSGTSDSSHRANIAKDRLRAFQKNG